MTILDSTLRISRTTQSRVDTAQRGRIAMETITRELRSQVCLSATAPALTTATATNVVFYVNLGAVDANPERHEISLTGGDVILRRFVGHRHPAEHDVPRDGDVHPHAAGERRDLRRHAVPALLRVAERQPRAPDDAAARRRSPRRTSPSP